MLRTVAFICILSVALSQYPQQRAPPRRSLPEYEADYDDYQSQPRAQPPPPPPPPSRVSLNSVRLRPASVHYVNIGTELAGDYKFGYDTGKGDDGQSFREETRLPDGTVQGAYGYVDEAGIQRIVKYTAGKDGFRVLKDGEGGSSQAASKPAPQPSPQRPQPAREPAYVPPPQPARAPAYVPPPQPAKPPVQNYAPAPQPARPRPVETYASQSSQRPEPAYRPEPVPQRAYEPPRPRSSPPRRQYVPRKPVPEEEPDYDYPDNDIQERRLVVVDTSLFNYNIGSNSNNS